MRTKRRARILYIPHGGGPLPLLDDAGHREMRPALEGLARAAGRPAAIVVVSAHWEAEPVAVTGSARPGLLYDYYGFPDEAYEIRYPAPGDPDLAKRIVAAVEAGGIRARPDQERAFDHGVFVPLALMYPSADIPCVQVSLARGLDSRTHVAVGRALAALADDDVLVLGSGSSFHNLPAFFGRAGADPRNDAFQDWLDETLRAPRLDEAERERRLVAWDAAPEARYAHPREEHLLPLHVCYGMAGRAADEVRGLTILGKRALVAWWAAP